ncbi:hypothetical protein HY993_01495 [Candidatus Micrarchaeota archaeon]|nr:hypothetical protein [Candidatus Micrarchaeota archaeon]
MVDVFIRNVDEKIYQRFKSRAAQEGLGLGEAFGQIVEKGTFEKKGAAGWLALPKLKLGKYASRKIDEIVGEEMLDDYNRYKRSGSKRKR